MSSRYPSVERHAQMAKDAQLLIEMLKEMLKDAKKMQEIVDRLTKDYTPGDIIIIVLLAADIIDCCGLLDANFYDEPSRIHAHELLR